VKPRVKYGLIVGLVGLILNACVSAAVGLCGPFLALLAGGAAGFLAAQGERPNNPTDGARLGAVAGGIAGALTLVGQLLGGVGMLVLFQRSGLSLPIGTIPDLSADPSRQLMYYTSGLGVGTCLGLTGVVLAALGGAGAGYLGTPTSLPTDPRSVGLTGHPQE
jgi:hypothetical protein